MRLVGFNKKIFFKMHGHVNVKFLVFIFSAVGEEGLCGHSMLSCGLF